jgi:two-component system, OmpR family, sensor histidine kinase KdpD
MASREKNLNIERDKRPFKSAAVWRGYFIGLGSFIIGTLLGYLVHTFFAPANIIMIYLLSVTVSAVLGGLGPSIMVSILSVLAFDFFFIPPYLTFAVDDTQYIFTFIALLFIGITISYLTSRIRRQTEAARIRERETAALYALSRDLAVSGELESHIKAIIKRITETLGQDVTIFLPDAESKEGLKPYCLDDKKTYGRNAVIAASRFFQQMNSLKHDTNKPSDKKIRYLPLATARGPVGVMSLTPSGVAGELTSEQERLIGAYADLSAVAIEGIRLADELHNAKISKATEKLQTALLNAISHDLRTPLVSVIGTLSSLQEEGINLDDASKRNLIQVAREEADRLNHLISNLLDESRIEAGALKLSRRPAEVQDLVGAALEQMGSHIDTRSIKIDIPSETPFVSVDFGLIVQTLVNILDNSLKYSPIDSPIEIKARQISKELHIEISDHGIGIPEQELAHVFDKFYRIKRIDHATGIGLGLSISKGIVEAHGGRIKAENNPAGGTIIKMVLPLDESGLNEGKSNHE